MTSAGGAVETGAHENRRLPLEAGVSRVEQLSAFDDRHADARIVPELGQPLVEMLAQRQLLPDTDR